jgi:hypothetical protein
MPRDDLGGTVTIGPSLLLLRTRARQPAVGAAHDCSRRLHARCVHVPLQRSTADIVRRGAHLCRSRGRPACCNPRTSVACCRPARRRCQALRGLSSGGWSPLGCLGNPCSGHRTPRTWSARLAGRQMARKQSRCRGCTADWVHHSLREAGFVSRCPGLARVHVSTSTPACTTSIIKRVRSLYAPPD